LLRLASAKGEGLFAVWTHAEHMTVVKNTTRVSLSYILTYLATALTAPQKGFGVQHACRKLPQKDPKEVKDYFFR